MTKMVIHTYLYMSICRDRKLQDVVSVRGASPLVLEPQVYKFSYFRYGTSPNSITHKVQISRCDVLWTIVLDCNSGAPTQPKNHWEIAAKSFEQQVVIEQYRYNITMLKAYPNLQILRQLKDILN